MIGTCATPCAFFHEGKCRRHAPVLTDRSWTNPNCPELGRNEQYLSDWPEVKPDDWCGDFEKRP